jgi:ABC-type transport system involved in multi-copper enzyme maturation permease subunit
MTQTIHDQEPGARTPQVPAPTGRVDGHVTLPRVVASEWLKLRSLRSTPLVLLAAMLAMVAFGAIIGHNTRDAAGLDPEDLVASGPLQGYFLGQLIIGSLGVLVVSGEYSTGMVRATLAAVPTRLPVLVAKLVVFTAVVLTAMAAASVVGFLVAHAFLSGYRPTYSLGDPDVLRVVIGTGVYLTLIGLLGGAIGWIVRSTPGALVALFGLILVLPVLLLLFHGAWAQHLGAWLPTGAGSSFSTSLRTPGALAPWPGLAVMVGWVLLAYVVAAGLLRRRDP